MEGGDSMESRHCEVMSKMAKQLRDMADAIDGLVQQELSGEDPDRQYSDANIEGDRSVEDITSNADDADVARAVRIIKLSL